VAALTFPELGDLARHHGMIWGGDWGTPGSKHIFVDTDHAAPSAGRLRCSKVPGIRAQLWSVRGPEI